MKVAAAALALVVWVGVADAGPKRKVRVETSPGGAIVYIEAKENGPACEPTPCTIELPVGETSLIIELPSYETRFQTVIVPKRGKIKLDSLTLDPSLGTLVVNSPVGASITVGGDYKGKAPTKIELPAETHKVVITKDGKTIFDQYVDIATDQEKELSVLDIRGGAILDGEAPAESGGPPEGAVDGGIVKTAPSPRRPPFVSVAAAMSIGFRSFTYQDNQSRDDLRDETESGQVILGPLVELWPGVLTPIHALRGLSFVGRFQFRLNEQPVTGGGIQNNLSTFWRSFEVSGRYKLMFGGKYGVELGAGWIDEHYSFNGTPADKLLVPDVEYSGLRVGGRFSMLVSAGTIGVEPYLDLETRIVTSGGRLQTRFGESTSVNGLRAALGAIARFGGFHVRAEAALQRYAWEFESTMDLVASGGTDLITLLGIYAGYAY